MKTNKYKRIKKKGRIYVTVDSIKGQNLNLREVEDIQNGILKNVIPLEVDMKRAGFVLKYDITNYMSMEQYLHTIITKQKYAQIMLQILEIIRRMSEAYYNPQNIILNLDNVYINPSTETIFFIFIPILYFDSGCSVKDFLTQITYQTTFDSSEDTSYVEKCLNILQRNMNFSAVEMEEYLKTILSDKKEPDKSDNQIRSIYREYNLAFEEKKAEQPVKERKEEKENLEIGRSTRMTESLSNIGSSDTVLLGTASNAYIKQLRTSKKYYLNSNEVTIGKRQCEIEIADNPAVSKHHAMIQKKEGKYYLVDLNSTNGTKVNGKKINADIPEFLQDETQIEFANEKFVFYE